jgi:hypothetical protein
MGLSAAHMTRCRRERIRAVKAALTRAHRDINQCC